MASARPDLVERWGTSDIPDEYYVNHREKSQEALRAGPLNQEYVCDRFGDFEHMGVGAGEADQVLARHVLEHLSITEVHRALDHCDEVLKQGGILRLDVPDHEKTLELYRETGDPFYKRHLFGPRRDDRGYHLVGYDRECLKEIVEQHGFIFVAEEPNIHFYPAFCLRFVKPGPRAAYEYVQLPAIPESWKVLEVGPGTFPWPRANVYLDNSRRILRPLEVAGHAFIVADLDAGLWEVTNHSFDFAYASHVLEHVQHPARAVTALQRIAKRGMIVMPSFAKESINWFEESSHLWLVLPHPVTGIPIFVRRNNKFIQQLADTELQRISCRSFRTGPNVRGQADRYCRSWWYHNERDLDVVASWDEAHPLEIQVIA